jgi:hypothetical protein
MLVAPMVVAANYYGTGDELAGNWGSQVTRLEVPVTCSGSGSGFVFDDLWQGVQNDAGWVEIGTSFCDQDDIYSKWVYA